MAKYESNFSDSYHSARNKQKCLGRLAEGISSDIESKKVPSRGLISPSEDVYAD